MFRFISYRASAVLVLSLVMILAGGCGADADTEMANDPLVNSSVISGESDPLATAAAQATVIIQQAQATAMVLQAEAEATRLVQGSEAFSQSTDLPTAVPVVDDAADTAAPVESPATDDSAVGDQVQVLGVGFGAGEAYIHVRFMAPPKIASRWQQGFIKVIDETTGHEYVEIPVVPVLGALFGKPIRDGQPGYVMLVNGPRPLGPGAQVTVVLGDHVEEGLVVGR